MKTSERNRKKERHREQQDIKEDDKRRTQSISVENERNFVRYLLCISRKIQDKSTESRGSGSNKDKAKGE